MLELHALNAFSDNYIWAISDASGNVAVVDPGDPAVVEHWLAAGNRRLCAILVTHHHADHIGGVGELRKRHAARVFAPDDPRIDEADRRLADGDELILDQPALRLAVLAVPGHTRSHIAFFGSGWLFCGDTLFSLGCGRLFEGTPTQMLASLDRLAALPGDTAVCCAHEYTLGNAQFALRVDPDNRDLQARAAEVELLRAQSRPTLPVALANERACNPFLRVHSAAVRAAIEARIGRPPADRSETFGALRAWKDTFRA